MRTDVRTRGRGRVAMCEAGAAGRWTGAEEQPSGARGKPAAFSLPLPVARSSCRLSLFLSPRSQSWPRVKASHGKFPARKGLSTSRAVNFPPAQSISRRAATAQSISFCAVDFPRPRGPRSFGALPLANWHPASAASL